MLLNSEQLSQYGFGWVIGSGPESGWISTYGELGWTPTDASEVRHYWALNRIWPIFDMYHAAGSLTDPMPVSLEPAITYPDAITYKDETVSNREYVHQSAMYKLLPLFQDGGLLPYIRSHPSDATVLAPDPGTFIVDIISEDYLTYQWQRDGTDIPTDATNQSYVTGATSWLSDNGSIYRCKICNINGCVWSRTGTLTVIEE
jgi:hypothetical protein